MDLNAKLERINKSASDRIEELVVHLQSAKENRNKGKDFEQLYSLTRNMVYCNIAAAGVPAKDREDVLQDTYVRIANSIDKIKDPAKAIPWIRRVAFNTAADYFRKSYNVCESLLYQELDEGSSAFSEDFLMQAIALPQNILENKELQKEVRAIIEQLPQIQYRILILYYFDEYKVKEISAMLNMAEGTVKSHLFRARKAIEEKVLLMKQEQEIRLYSFSPVPVFAFLFAQNTILFPFAGLFSLLRRRILNKIAFSEKAIAGKALFTKSSLLLIAGTAAAAGTGYAVIHQIRNNSSEAVVAAVSEEAPKEVPALSSSESVFTKEPEEAGSEPGSEPEPAGEQPHTHIWVEMTKTVHHDEITHTERIQTGTDRVQTGTRTVEKTVHHDAEYQAKEIYGSIYTCNLCGTEVYSYDEIMAHLNNEEQTVDSEYRKRTDVIGTEQEEIKPAYDEIVYEEEPVYEDRPVYEEITVTDEEAWDETVVTGYQCSICQEKRQLEKE